MEQNREFETEKKQEKYELTITADTVTSTDERFEINNLSLGNEYKPLDTYFIKGNGEVIRRKYNKGERRNTNQTMPRIACQVFEKQIASLSAWDKERFPICQYTPKNDIICGIFSTVEEFRKLRNTIEYMVYRADNGPQFVIYCWNIFSTIMFVQECLKRFGEPGDHFVLFYRQKEEQEVNKTENETPATEEQVQQFNGYRNPYSAKLIQSKNIIFRGAPGTGKTYLAKEIAADIISNGYFDDHDLLSDEQKKQIEFVQFHPNYDYSDFVEGLRPKMNEDGTIGFELRDGIFKKFVARARKNYENSRKTKEKIEQEKSAYEAMTEFFSDIELDEESFHTVKGTEFYITGIDDTHIYISIPKNETSNKLILNTDELRRLLESGEKFEKISDIKNFFGKQFATQEHSYYFVILKEIEKRKSAVSNQSFEPEKLKNYIFIIDEINRGEISKILGELFFSIDPGYRGPAGEVSTQYSNMHAKPEEKFYIPENVYIIGTMNDIDRSVDSFDFAMRRRFRFIEIKADERLEMLDSLEDDEKKNEAIRRMTALNEEIVKVEDLNENYQIGASYFLKLKTLDFDELWTDCLQPLLRDYIQGMYDEKIIMSNFERAYGYKNPDGESSDEAVQN